MVKYVSMHELLLLITSAHNAKVTITVNIKSLFIHLV